MEMVIGTTNKGKVREYGVLLAEAPVTLLSLDDVGLGGLDVDETGTTFRENAEIKALAYAKASGRFALADDSGICVDALDGGPGIYSARYGGPNITVPEQRAKMLGELRDIPDAERSARFVCVIAVADPNTMTCVFTEGVVEGRIAHEARGDGGFGYDPLFVPEGHTATFGELPASIKHDLSHRGRAARQLIPILQRLARQQR